MKKKKKKKKKRNQNTISIPYMISEFMGRSFVDKFEKFIIDRSFLFKCSSKPL